MSESTIASEMVLRTGYLAVAQKLQEAAETLTANDVRSRLSDAVNDVHRGTNTWGYYIDHIGDAESGDCIYYCGGDMRSAPYEISSVGGKVSVMLDTENSKNVVPRTTYEEEADEADHYAGMEESFKTEKLYSALPVYERFIGKSERTSADEGSFAGKGKSYPILKPEDVKAAVSSMGRAGSGNYGMAQLKANIISIAKKKGWTKYLPKAWRGTDAAESEQKPRETKPNSLKLIEAAPAFCGEIHLSESARVNYPIKIISPGTGSSAHYTEALLKAAAAKFAPGTLMFWNHPTAAEEASRPEGDLDNLAAITTKAAYWDPAGVKGPGLYAEAKVMADYAQKVEERAPHIGLSIRAGGRAGSKTIDGKPVLESIDYVESVDYVTKAGRGGVALAEAARDAGLLPENEGDMDETTVKRLIAEASAPLLMRAVRGDAKEYAAELLEGSNFPKSARLQIIERSIADVPLKDGELDREKFRDSVLKESKEMGVILAEATGAGKVFGLGTPAPATTAPTLEQLQLEERQNALAEQASKRLREAEESVFGRLMGNPQAAKAAASKVA